MGYGSHKGTWPRFYYEKYGLGPLGLLGSQTSLGCLRPVNLKAKVDVMEAGCQPACIMSTFSLQIYEPEQAHGPQAPNRPRALLGDYALISQISFLGWI